MNRLVELLCPSQYATAVSDIDLASLRERRYRAILTDLDNTLVPWHGYDVSPAVREWLGSARDLGFDICIVSNTRYPGRLRKLAEEMDLPFVNKVLKPRRGGFRQALEVLGVPPNQAIVVGDQVFTDILGGNRLGLYTILVKPLSRKEFIGTKVSRFFERILLGFLERRGIVRCDGGGKSPSTGTLIR